MQHGLDARERLGHPGPRLQVGDDVAGPGAAAQDARLEPARAQGRDGGAADRSGAAGDQQGHGAPLVGARTALCEESLASLHRLATYATQVCDKHGLSHVELAALSRDVEELERSANSLEGHLTHLQNATLGLVGAGQNDTLKALALATIFFVPPTLIASIFGMNFEAMTWFKTSWGPWVGFAMMIAAPAALFALARWRRWF